MHKKLVRGTGIIVLLICALLAAVAVSLCTGSSHIPVSRVLPALFSAEDTVEHAIVASVRLPRVLLGIAVGGALALAGVILQGIFRNPLVEPYTLGISGGAALGVCLCILLQIPALLGGWSLPACGFMGAASTLILLYVISTRKRVMNIRDLLLIGVMISFVSSSLVMLIMAISGLEDLHGIIFWIMGSLEQQNSLLVKIACTVSVLSLVIAFMFCMDLNALSLGEDEATHLGLNVDRTKKILFLLASITTGLSVSVAGVIGFVGLVIPHFMRMITGNDHRILLIASWLCGAVFLVLCDTLARTVISPMELPVGVITGILGGSIFVYGLSRSASIGGRK